MEQQNSAPSTFKEALNILLFLYYQIPSSFDLERGLKISNYPVSLKDAETAYDTLITDGYIEHELPDKKRLHVFKSAKITGKGRLFLEQGGYQDETTRFDRTVKWAKNHKVIAWLIFFSFVFTFFITLTQALIAIYEFLTK